MSTLFIMACTRKEVLDDIDSQYFKDQLVIHSIISPGDSIFVYVGKTIPLGDSIIENAKVFDAQVTISDASGKAIELPLLKPDTPVYGISQDDFAIRAGETYTLSVSQTDYLVASASCTVPDKATPITEVQNAGTIFVEEGQTDYLVRVLWEDTDRPYVETIYAIDHYAYFNSETDSFLEEGTQYRSVGVFSDIQRVGQQYMHEDQFFKALGSNMCVSNVPSSCKRDIPEVTIIHDVNYYLITADENLAQYQFSFDFFRRNERILDSDSFLGLYRGIMPEYSNVENGLGVFGAYLRSEPYYIRLE